MPVKDCLANHIFVKHFSDPCFRATRVEAQDLLTRTLERETQDAFLLGPRLRLPLLRAALSLA